MYRSLLALVAAVLLAVFLPSSAFAEDAPATARAARLTYLQGSVSVDRADNTESQPAQLNLPLLAGVRIATGDDGQAEVEFEDGSVVRLTPNSALSLDNMTVELAGDGAGVGKFTTGLSLLHGLAYLELRATPNYKYTLDAGGDTVSPVENTTVRVNFDEPPATFAVMDGTAKVVRASGANGAGYEREVRVGESLRSDASDPTRYTLTQEIAQDSWDDWNQARDRDAVNEATSRTGARDNYAGAQGYGWSDLDANGSWYDVPGQGPVWQPNVAVADAGFDPYANGSWVSYPGTGYVWASGYGWGWTPYRCGNWSYFNEFGWGWAPGSGCGGLGWAFVGGGRPVNIRYPPNGYRVPHVPNRPPGPVHPILPGRSVENAALPGLGGGASVLAGGAIVNGPRRINGITVMPLEHVGGGYTARGGPAGSALQRDFPVDRTNHTAVTGVVSTQPGMVRDGTAWRSSGVRPAAPAPAYRGQGVPMYRVPAGTAAPRSAPPAGQVSRPAQQSAPARSGPPPAPASHPAAAPSAPAASRPR